MKETPISELVKNKEWQKVRESLLGQWKTKSEWCIKQLRDYLGPIDEASEDKLKIVMNYLTGTGFRIGTISSRDNPGIPALRGEISAEMKKRKFK